MQTNAESEAELRERIEALEAEHERKDDEIERLSRDLASERARTTELENKVEALESQSDASAENDESDEPDDRRSSLAQLIDLPAEKASEVLSENQERGRSVAQRARELGTNTQAGLVVRSKDVARHLKERGENAHDETVSRVMNFVDELGETDVDAKMHKGKRILVFNPDRVNEYGTGEEPDVIHSHRDVMYAREGGPTKSTV